MNTAHLRNIAMMASFKKSRLVHNLEAPPSSDLAGAVASVEALREENRKRAEKFGVAYVEPNIAAAGILDKTTYLRLVKQRSAGEVTGFDATSAEEAERRAARAKRFEISSFNYVDEGLRLAGFTEDEIRLRKERRERAAKYDVADPIDLAIAQAAYEALGQEPEFTTGSAAAPASAASASDAPMDSESLPMSQVATQAIGGSVGVSGDEVMQLEGGSGANRNDQLGSGAGQQQAQIRGNALHMRAYKYLPAASADIFAFFSPIKPSFVEWLNGQCLNVLFEDEGTAKRAFELTSEPVPSVKGVPPVKDCWRVCLKPLLKLRTDKYAPEGSTTTVYLRMATTEDTREKYKGTAGPRRMGTFSKDGEFSLAKVSSNGMDDILGYDEDGYAIRAPKPTPSEEEAKRMVLQPGLGLEPPKVDPGRVVLNVNDALRETAQHVTSSLSSALPERAPRPEAEAPIHVPTVGGASRLIQVKKRSGEGMKITLEMPSRPSGPAIRPGFALGKAHWGGAHGQGGSHPLADPSRSGGIAVTKRRDQVGDAGGVQKARGRGKDRAAQYVTFLPAAGTTEGQAGGKKRRRGGDGDEAMDADAEEAQLRADAGEFDRDEAAYRSALDEDAAATGHPSASTTAAAVRRGPALSALAAGFAGQSAYDGSGAQLSAPAAAGQAAAGDGVVSGFAIVEESDL